MPLSLWIVLSLILMLVNFGLSAAVFWGAARLGRIPNISFRRAMGVVLLMDLLSVLAGIVLAGFVLRILPGFSACCVLVLNVLGDCWIVKRLFRTTWLRGLGVYLLGSVGCFACGFALARGVRATLCEAFIMPTGSMAPTICGQRVELICRHCGLPYAVGMSQHADGPSPGPAEQLPCPNCRQQQSLGDAPLVSGDRLLVDKTVRPGRWQLMAFDLPTNPQVKYVKRVVGLPGERVDLVGGDVFINGRRLQKPPGSIPDMWLLVHDGRFVPPQISADTPGWQPARAPSGWRRDGRNWVFAGGKVAGDDVLRFTGPITDELAYNMASGFGAFDKPVNVGDVKVECRLQSFSGGGRLEFRWEFGGRQVTAVLSAAGDVEITAAAVGPAEARIRLPASCRESLGRPLRAGDVLAFAFRDGLGYVTVGGRVVASLAVSPDEIAEASREAVNALGACRLGIAAAGGSAALGPINVWKDVYYRTVDAETVPRLEQPAAADPLAGYFVLGDNSPRSADSRFWGRVGEKAVMGMARWIYWPPARWHEFQ